MFKWPEQVIARLPLPEGYYWQDETAASQASIRHDRAAAPGMAIPTDGDTRCHYYTVKWCRIDNGGRDVYIPQYELVDWGTPEDAARYLYHFTLFVYEPKEYP